MLTLTTYADYIPDAGDGEPAARAGRACYRSRQRTWCSCTGPNRASSAALVRGCLSSQPSRSGRSGPSPHEHCSTVRRLRPLGWSPEIGALAIRSFPKKPGLQCAVLDASDDVVRLAERREPLTAQARARIN